MSAPMHNWVLQWSSQHVKGAPLTNYIATHLNVPWKRWSAISSTICVEQENQPPQPITLVTPTMQKKFKSQLVQTLTQHQCHPPIVEI
jgi:hypothetical protein